MFSRVRAFNCSYFHVRQKNLNIKTVVNKLNNINTQFRFFEMELLAGIPEYIVTVVSLLTSKSGSSSEAYGWEE